MSRGAKRNGRAQPPGHPGQQQRAQPIQAAANAGGYGDRKAAVAQQQAAPLRAGGVNAPVPQVGAGGEMPGEPVPTPIDPFGPTQRPYEPITSGAALGAGPQGPSARETAADLARALFELNPYDDNIRDLLEELGG